MQALSPTTTKRQLRSHTRRSMGPFSCQLCHKSFSRVENLTRHAENHKATAKFVCNVCGKRFTRSDILKRHVKIHRTSEGGYPQIDPTTPSAFSHQGPLQHGSRSLPQITPIDRQLDSLSRPAPMFHHAASGSSQPAHSSYGSPGTARIVGDLDIGIHEGPVNPVDSFQDAVAPTSMVLPSPESSNSCAMWPDGYYGIYGEGSFDADIAWILDMTPMDDMTIERHHNIGQQPTGIPPPGRQGSSDEPAQIGHTDLSSSIENRNDWPDEDALPGTAGPMEVLETTNIPDSQSWVDQNEILSFTQQSSERPIQVIGIDADIRAHLMNTLLHNSSPKDDLLPPDESHFPSPQTLEYFLTLFFEHVHPRFPVIHPASFSVAETPPFLLLSMMILGSSHSRTNYGKFVAIYLRPVIVMFLRLHTLNTTFLRLTDNMLTLLFLCVSGAWCGHKSAFEFAEGARGILVTACRRCKLLDCRPHPSPSDVHQSRSMRSKLHEAWRAWIVLEQRKRLGLSIHMFDLQFPALFHNQPYISKAETVNLVLPCDAVFWEAKSAEAWKVLLGPAEMPSSTYFMVPLDTCLLYPAIQREPPYAPIDSFSKTLLMYALITHIFEWRQSLNIVMHSAFIRGPESTSPGEGLMERKNWLKDALSAWLKHYHRPATGRDAGSPAPPAALLLNFLASIYIDISISDLHLFAGRSSLTEDIKLAEHSLRRWCRSPGSILTIQNVHAMLDLAHQTIDNGLAHDCAFEISVALLTGGLTCWMFETLGGHTPSGAQLRKASKALERMNSWGICTSFAQILKRFIT